MPRIESATAFYRHPSDPHARIEDGHFMNLRAGVFGVADGVSAAFSPSNPPFIYQDTGFTGGQTAASVIEKVGHYEWASGKSLEWIANAMNLQISAAHHLAGWNSEYDDVGGAGIALWKNGKDGGHYLLCSDCSVFIVDTLGFHFNTGFDEKAEAIEEADERRFAELLKEHEGSKGKTWDAYFPEYRKKRLTYINKRMGEGGFSLLNGNPNARNCWTLGHVSWQLRPRLIALMTDGMLPSSWTKVARRDELLEKLAELVPLGPDALLAWRDKEVAKAGDAPHISGHPEATMITLKFDF